MSPIAAAPVAAGVALAMVGVITAVHLLTRRRDDE